jgi:hypothetical protein
VPQFYTFSARIMALAVRSIRIWQLRRRSKIGDRHTAVWTDKWKVASGSYNRMIDDKIAGTKRQCGGQASAIDSE